MRVVLIATAASMLLAGCAGGPPTKADGSAISIADAGAPPDRGQVIRSYLRTLKDPSSAQVDGEFGPVFIKQAAGIGGPATYGWGICFQVNAKNSYGAYVGFSTTSVIWRDGTIQRVYDGTHWSEQMQANAICDTIRKHV